MEYKVGVISGDGIGPEIVTEAKKVLDQIGKKYGHLFHYDIYQFQNPACDRAQDGWTGQL